MHILTTPESRELSKALEQMRSSLRILDGLSAPGEVGAMLDLAIARLEAALEAEKSPGEVQSLIDRLEQELGSASVEPVLANPWEVYPI